MLSGRSAWGGCIRADARKKRDEAGARGSRSVLAWRRCVIGEVDLEYAGIDLLGGIQIVDRNRGVIALRVGDGPLLELTVLGADQQHQSAGADQRLLLLDGDADVNLIRGDAHDVGVL